MSSDTDVIHFLRNRGIDEQTLASLVENKVWNMDYYGSVVSSNIITFYYFLPHINGMI